jgi:Holliday junction resolvase
MGAKSRRKGASAEREVVAILRAAGLEAERRAPMQASIDADDPDIFAPAIGRVEIKRRARGFALLYEALAKADVAIVRDDRGEWLVVEPLRTFITRKARHDD